MDKFFKSKLFVVLAPTLNFLLFIVAGVKLSYVPHISGYTSGASGFTKGETTTEYVFSINNAIGIWLIGIATSLLMLLVCVLIRKISLKSAENK